jgi:hypothetical protein
MIPKRCCADTNQPSAPASINYVCVRRYITGNAPMLLQLPTSAPLFSDCRCQEIACFPCVTKTCLFVELEDAHIQEKRSCMVLISLTPLFLFIWVEEREGGWREFCARGSLLLCWGWILRTLGGRSLAILSVAMCLSALSVAECRSPRDTFSRPRFPVPV